MRLIIRSEDGINHEIDKGTDREADRKDGADQDW